MPECHTDPCPICYYDDPDAKAPSIWPDLFLYCTCVLAAWQVMDLLNLAYNFFYPKVNF